MSSKSFPRKAFQYRAEEEKWMKGIKSDLGTSQSSISFTRESLRRCYKGRTSQKAP